MPHSPSWPPASKAGSGLREPEGVPRRAWGASCPGVGMLGVSQPGLRWAWQGPGEGDIQASPPSRSRFPRGPAYSDVPGPASTPAPGRGNLFPAQTSSGSDRRGAGQSEQLRLPPSTVTTNPREHRGFSEETQPPQHTGAVGTPFSFGPQDSQKVLELGWASISLAPNPTLNPLQPTRRSGLQAGFAGPSK